MGTLAKIITAASGINVAIGTFVVSAHPPFYANEGLHIANLQGLQALGGAS